MLLENLPKNIPINTFPIYSGCFEILADLGGYKVVGHTNNLIVGEFWLTINENKEVVSEMSKVLSKIIDEQTFEIMQKDWFKQIDPNLRASLFFLLNNLSSTSMASSGVLISPRPAIEYDNVENYKPVQVAVQEKPTLEYIQELADKEECLFYHGEKYYKLAKEENKIVGVDGCELNQREIITILNKSYNPWFASMPPSTDLLELFDKRHRLLPVNNEGKLCKRDDAVLWLFTNI